MGKVRKPVREKRRGGLEILGVAALFVLALLPLTFAGNFGSAAKTSTANILEGTDAHFSLVFWTTDEAGQTIELEAISMPEGWNVDFDKKRFRVSSSEGSEMVFASGRYLRATTVGVAVKTAGAPEGTYHIVVVARTSTGGDISLGQERVFNLAVNIGSKPLLQAISDVAARPVLRDLPEEISNVVPAPLREVSYAYLLAIILVILVSYLIYRYS